jgi:Protein of unknown function (DUF2688)
MRRTRIQIITTSCRRCGKPLATLSRSLYGAERAKANLDRICGDCVTEEERQEMLVAQAQAILGQTEVNGGN